MKFKIHGTYKNGDEDYLIIEEDSIEEVRESAKQETELRGWTDCWSEKIE